jgi:predicted MFS family arabinose efflux permease
MTSDTLTDTSGRRTTLGLLFIGRAMSQIGTSLQGIAQSLIILSYPHGDRLVGIVAVLPTVSVLLLGWLGGRLADRFSPRGVLLSTQPVLALIALSLGLGHPGIVGLLTGILLLNLVAALGTAAWQLVISEKAGDGRARPGAIVNTVALDAGLIVGSFMAAPAVATLGPSGLFLLNAVSYLVPAAVLAGLGRRRERPPATSTEQVTLRTVGRSLAGDRELLSALAGATMAALVGTGLPTLLLLLVHQERATDVAVYGLFLGAMSMGSLTGGVMTWRRGASARVVQIEVGVLGAAVLGVSAMSGTAMTVAVLLPVGFLFLTLRVGVTTLLMKRVPDRARATTISLMSVVLAGAQIIGTTGFAALATSVGARRTLAVAGSLLLATGIAIMTHRWKRSRWN